MNPHDYIEYKGKKYPVFYLELESDTDAWSGESMVATEVLRKVLIDDSNGLPVDKEAECVDHDIFFYIPDEVAGWKEEDIVEFINENL